MDTLLNFSSMDDIMEPARKRSRPSDNPPTLTYASVSSGYCDQLDDDDDNESVHSWQSAETVLVGDSGDDWVPSSDENVEEEPLSEYELLDEESSEQYSSDTSSSLSDVLTIPAVLTDRTSVQHWEASSFADLSGWESSPDKSTSTSSDYFSSSKKSSWNCLKCRKTISYPMRFCFTCNQKRKCGLPPRPDRRKMRKPSRKIKDALSSSSTAVVVAAASLEKTGTAAPGSNTCAICLDRPRDGAFVHGRRAHVAYCFQCTEEIARKRGARCPFCRQFIQKSIKIFFS